MANLDRHIIRELPSHFTFSSIPGHVPDCLDSEFEEYFALGPITRYAEDLTLLLKVLKQPNGPDVPLDKPVSVYCFKV